MLTDYMEKQATQPAEKSAVMTKIASLKKTNKRRPTYICTHILYVQYTVHEQCVAYIASTYVKKYLSM